MGKPWDWKDNVIQNYSLQLLDRGFSHAYVNQAISAIKFYADRVLGVKDGSLYIRPKIRNKLPFVLTAEEVLLILKSVRNAMHQAIRYLTYSSGLRVGEVVRLQLQDLEVERKVLRIRQGKGRKDRLTVLSDQAMVIVAAYLQQKGAV